MADDPVAVVIPYKNPKALLGYYLGVFGVIPPLGAVLGPAALVLGILGIRYRSGHPERHGMGHAIFAVIAGTILTLVYAGIAVAIAVR